MASSFFHFAFSSSLLLLHSTSSSYSSFPLQGHFSLPKRRRVGEGGVGDGKGEREEGEVKLGKGGGGTEGKGETGREEDRREGNRGERG